MDELLLDDEQLLLRRDSGRLLWSLAGAGAQVRRAVELAAEFDLDRLAGERPRAVLLVGDPPARGALRVLCHLLAPAAPVLVWGGTDLPRWAGPTDALLAAAVDGRHPRLMGIVEQAARRGLLTAVVAPDRSPVAQAAGRSPLARLDNSTHARAALWAVLTPLLQAAVALGIWVPEPGLYVEVAAALDAGAEQSRPGSDPFTNQAKSLAVEFSESLPLVAGAGPLAGVAARLVADGLRLLAGAPAVSVTLPDGMAAASAVLLAASAPAAGATDEDDFFRDRLEQPVTRPRLVVIGDEADTDAAGSQLSVDDRTARRAADALHQLAMAHGARSSTFGTSAGPPLARLAEAWSFGMFTATYLSLGLGQDPSAARPGELT
jgi:hypothetical protein